jgi:hypothetical protein
MRVLSADCRDVIVASCGFFRADGRNEVADGPGEEG